MGVSPKIFCAVDSPDINEAVRLAGAVGAITGGIKLGLEFFNAQGPQGVKSVSDAIPGAELFLDLKYHDIPNTAAAAIRSAAHLKPAYLNVHASGGFEMMKAARAACPPETRLLAVTVLTSLDLAMLAAVGQGRDTGAQVERLAVLAKEAGLDGVVCSPHEIALVRKACGDDFILMVPGIRPEGSDRGDQSRIMTPKQAVDQGATHLVIGRPITRAPDPQAAAQAILDSLA